MYYRMGLVKDHVTRYHGHVDSIAIVTVNFQWPVEKREVVQIWK